MAVRRIRGEIRDRYNAITLAFCIGGDVDLVLVGNVIDDIQANRHEYVVDAGGELARLHVVHQRDGRIYLRTNPDSEPANNLDALPACDTLPRVLPARIRRNVATVGEAERTRLRNAIIELNRRFLTPEDGVSMWFKQDQIHQATHVHHEASFLPWHRVLVNEFERQLQEIDHTLALHYWDWTTDPRRAPDGQGGTVNLLDSGFMGESTGPIGSPFLEAGFYRPTPPNRDYDAQGNRRNSPMPNLAPEALVRGLPSSGRGPREVTLDDVAELYTACQPNDRPRSEELIRMTSDEDVVGSGFDRPGVEFERLWRALYFAHALAHRYIGGNIGGACSDENNHRSFEDPFVFLLHSNVDRLWASWQLSQRGFDAWREPAWRIDPLWTYGQLIDGRLEVAGWVDPRGPDEALEQYEARYNGQLEFQARRAKTEIESPMAPWNGRGNIKPWTTRPRSIRPLDMEVLRPPLYDRYVFEDNLCAAWATLQLGRRLATHDVVRLTVELDAVDPANVEFVLETGPEVSSWKALELPNGTMMETTGRLRRVSANHPVAELPGEQLIFHKAQGDILLGARTSIGFRVADMEWIPPGSRLTFQWEDD